MATSNHNHANYQQRMDYIQKLIVAHLELTSDTLQATTITPIQYSPTCPFKYNNFVYHIVLPKSASSISHFSALQPGTIAIPLGTTQFIVRLSNTAAEGLYQPTRVQNEVGMLHLASLALSRLSPSIVPRVYAWGSNRTSSGIDEPGGFIFQEFMPGVPLSSLFDEMLFVEKKGVLAQMAEILRGLQDLKLPESIQGWGSVTFDVEGEILGAPMIVTSVGPWESLLESFKGRFAQALKTADENVHLQGWRTNGVRERIDRFVELGLGALVEKLVSKEERGIVHGDFTTDNLLFDAKTKRITAILDFDFACITHPAHEFFVSFAGTGGPLSDWSSDPSEAALRDANLTGVFPEPLPAGEDWVMAKVWEEELASVDAKRPSTMEGVGGVADVEAVLGLLLPWKLTNEDALARSKGVEERQVVRASGEKAVMDMLEHLGF